ncbi:hypothetical protein YC2023_011454 [Brassica napus]
MYVTDEDIVAVQKIPEDALRGVTGRSILGRSSYHRRRSRIDDTFCFGMCKGTKIEMLPFPQDKILSVVHTDSSGNRDTSVKKEIEKGMCCFLDILQVKKLKPLDPRNIYQTVKINRRHDHTFFAKSVAPDGTPPLFLKKKGWELPTSRSLHPRGPRETLGLNDDLRARLPEFGFSVSTIWSGSVIEGEWYCPFMFVKENCSASHQMKKSMFYRMTLSQYW